MLGQPEQPEQLAQPGQLPSSLLDLAFHQAGKWLLNLYLTDMPVDQLTSLTRDPAKLRQVIDQAISDINLSRRIVPERKLLETRNYPSVRTSAMLDLLDSAVRGSASLTGLSLAEAVSLIDRELGHKLSPNSLGTALQRNSEHHRLALKRGRVRLRSDIVVEVIGRKHALKQAQQAQRKFNAADDIGKVLA